VLGLKAHVRWKLEEHPDLKQEIVIGKLPGMTGRKHRHGVAHGRLLRRRCRQCCGHCSHAGHRRVFSPRCRRKSAAAPCTFVALLDHHSGDRGSRWLHDNFKSVFAKTAMIVNS
jgi:hypothetical protein